ncbi:MAG: penicillin-binding protein activator [Rhodobacteraceae bacterium]|nr:penicillin-binding protein activator [Paracoccaceae bacterium]
MVAGFTLARKLQRRVLLLLVAFALAACDPLAMGGVSVNTRKAVPVALLVPASAPDGGAALAQSFENAARLAIGDLEGVEIDLRVYDTGGQAGTAATVAAEAVSDGARIILGPLFAESANAAGVAVAPRGVNVLSFSNNPAIAGGNVFILGATFQNTANRLTRHLTLQGRSDIFVVHAQSAAEETGRAAISRAIAANGARLAGSTSFALTQQAVIEAIPVIADEVRASGASSIFMTSGNDGAIPFLAELLPENGIDPEEIQFVGLQRLDIPSGALALDGLQGAIFAVPDPALSAQFRARYQAAFGGVPHPLAGLAYDGVAAIGALLATGQSDALTAPALTRPAGFAGVNGVFRLLPNGTNERGLAIAQVQDKQVVFIDPAPRSFGLPGL